MTKSAEMRRPSNPYAVALRVARSARHLSIAELSTATGLSRQILYQYERGRSIPGDDALDKLLRALEISRASLGEHRGNDTPALVVPLVPDACTQSELWMLAGAIVALRPRIGMPDVSRAGWFGWTTYGVIVADAPLWSIAFANDCVKRGFRVIWVSGTVLREDMHALAATIDRTAQFPRPRSRA